MAAVNSILLYESKIRGDALEIESKQEILAAVQQTAALRVASAYSTKSCAAVLVFIGVIPIDLLVFERRRSWKGRGRISPLVAQTLDLKHYGYDKIDGAKK